MSHKPVHKGPMAKVRLVRYLILLVVAIVFIVFLLPRFASLGNYVDVVKKMSVGFVILAFLCQVCAYLGNGFLLQALVGLSNAHISIRRGALITLAANSVGMVTGGWVSIAAVTYFLVSRKKEVNITEGAVLSGALPTVLNNLLLVILSLGGLAVLLANHQGLSAWQIIVYGFVFILAGLGITLLILSMRYQDKVERIVLWFADRIMQALHRTCDHAKVRAVTCNVFMSLEMLRRRGWIKPVIGSCIYILFDMLTIFFFFLAAGFPVRLSVMLPGYALALLLGKGLFFIPGGIGVVESSMAAIYTNLGVTASVSIAVIFGYRFFSFWIPTLLGFPLMTILSRTSDKSHVTRDNTADALAKESSSNR